jgi:hypothetical protein
VLGGIPRVVFTFAFDGDVIAEVEMLSDEATVAGLELSY